MTGNTPLGRKLPPDPPGPQRRTRSPYTPALLRLKPGEYFLIPAEHARRARDLARYWGPRLGRLYHARIVSGTGGEAGDPPEGVNPRSTTSDTSNHSRRRCRLETEWLVRSTSALRSRA